MVSAPQKREGAWVLKVHRIPERRVAALVGLSRSGLRYRVRPKPQDHLAERVKALSLEHPRYGQPRIWALLRRSGIVVNHKALARLWQKFGLQLTRRRKRKKVLPGASVPCKAEHPNHVWTYDFVFEWSLAGTQLKFLTLEDEYTRESLAIEVGTTFRALRVREVLAQVIAERGAPGFIRSDNGPEFIAMEVSLWLVDQGIRTRLIDPGKPCQNGFAESFNARFREEPLYERNLVSLPGREYLCSKPGRGASERNETTLVG